MPLASEVPRLSTPSITASAAHAARISQPPAIAWTSDHALGQSAGASSIRALAKALAVRDRVQAVIFAFEHGLALPVTRRGVTPGHPGGVHDPRRGHRVESGDAPDALGDRPGRGVQRRRVRHRHHAARAGDPASDDFDHLWHALLHEWPSYLAYVTSFLTVGSVWIAHHGLFVGCATSTRCCCG